MKRLRIRRGKKGWWIKGHKPKIGPYRTKADAQEGLRGIKLFYRYKDVPGFITSEDRNG